MHFLKAPYCARCLFATFARLRQIERHERHPASEWTRDITLVNRMPRDASRTMQDSESCLLKHPAFRQTTFLLTRILNIFFPQIEIARELYLMYFVQMQS